MSNLPEGTNTKYRIAKIDGTPIPPNEPCFIVRGQDELSALIVGIYIHLYKEQTPESSAKDATIAQLATLQERMKAWPVKKHAD